VQVDEAGQHEQAGGVEHLGAVGGEALPDRSDEPVAEEDVERPVAARRRVDDAAAAHEESPHIPSRSPSQGRPARRR
jgi:hypothetical protein